MQTPPCPGSNDLTYSLRSPASRLCGAAYGGPRGPARQHPRFFPHPASLPHPTGGLGEGRDHFRRFNFALQNRTWLRGSLFPVPEVVFQEPAVARSLWRRIVSQRRILPACL